MKRCVPLEPAAEEVCQANSKPVSAEKIEAEREKTKDDALKAAAEFLNIDVSLLSIVSEEEYLTETEKDLQN